MTAVVPRLACAACGWTPGPPEVDPYPFRCARAGTDDGDHVMTVGRGFSPALARGASPPQSDNPFIRYRTSLYSWQLARSRGLSDADYVSIVERVDAAVAGVAGAGFHVTPFIRAGRLGERLAFNADGGIWVKDETGNVAGSHKARHLMGVALYLEVLRSLGIGRDASAPLAIASCGNAALAAAVVARAIGRTLLVFVPDHASSAILDCLRDLGAVVTRCPRRADTPGDPSYAAFRDAVAHGALPFGCQGNENGLAIEGAKTLVYEMLEQAPGVAFDRLFIQVGGGALASACVQAIIDLARRNCLAVLPRVHAVQTCGGHPLERAYDRVVERVHGAPRDVLSGAMDYARAHRSEFMWPWETEPRSIAGGILDDETYDWAVVVEGLIRTGGSPVVVDEPTLEEANSLARETTGIDVDPTGSSGLAGLIAVSRSPEGPQRSQRVAVLFTGVRR